MKEGTCSSNALIEFYPGEIGVSGVKDRRLTAEAEPKPEYFNIRE
jgi:hypothetical protein